MSKSVNKVILIGTLGRDPETKYLPSGSLVATLSIATDESYNDKQTGQKVEKTEWHRVTAFGKLAEIIGQYLTKGSKAYFEGKLRTNEYEKDGIKRYSTEIVANEMTMLDTKPQDANPAQPMQNQQWPDNSRQPSGAHTPPGFNRNQYNNQQQNQGAPMQTGQPQQPYYPNQGHR